jgi:phage shock protein A
LDRMTKGLVHGLLAPAEDPRQTFGNAYQRHRESLLRVQRALSEIAAAKSRLETKTAEVRQKLPLLEEQARRALLANREDLARLALRRRQVAAAEVRTLEEQLNEVEMEEHRLSLVEQRLATQIEAFYARQEVLEARYSAAEAQVWINEALSGVSSELADLGTALEKAEAKTERMQARATALDQLIDDGILDVALSSSGPDPLESSIGVLDVAQETEAQLVALRSELKLAELPKGDDKRTRR